MDDYAMWTEMHQETCRVSFDIHFCYLRGRKEESHRISGSELPLHQSTFKAENPNIISNYGHSMDTPVSEMLSYSSKYNIHKPFLGLQRASHIAECLHVAKSRPGTTLSHLLFRQLANYTRVKVFVKHKLQSRRKHDTS
jgi:hypothetical protein